MSKDFYLNDRSTAAYFEKDWYDHIARPEAITKFAFKPFSPARLYSPSHQQLRVLLETALAKIDFAPQHLLEIGCSLGRTFFEVCRAYPSLKRAQLFEPSQNLWRLFNTIFVWPEPVQIQVIKGNIDLYPIDFVTKDIRAACAHVDWSCLNQSYQDWQSKPEEFDLTICSNVIDQCHDPERLVAQLKAATAPGGVMVLSCTYQWQNRYVGNASKPILDIKDLFGDEWTLLAEEDIPFEFRVNERYWMKFLSHACVMRKEIVPGM